eukprot:5400085-Pleurochrysis_carterae.AAC.2
MVLVLQARREIFEREMNEGRPQVDGQRQFNVVVTTCGAATATVSHARTRPYARAGALARAPASSL